MSILRVGESGSIWVVENGRNPYEVYVPDPRTLRRSYKNNFNLIETKVVTRGRPIREVCDNTRTGLMSCAWWRRPRRDVLVMVYRVLLERLNVEVVAWSRFLRGIAGNRTSSKGEGSDRASTRSASDSSRVEPLAQRNGTISLSRTHCRILTIWILLISVLYCSKKALSCGVSLLLKVSWGIVFYWNNRNAVNRSGREAARLAIMYNKQLRWCISKRTFGILCVPVLLSDFFRKFPYQSHVSLL